MSGASGLGTRSIARYTGASLSAADAQNLSSILSGVAWNSTSITYSFPTSSSVYGTQGSYGNPAPFNEFSALTTQQRGEVQRAFSLISSYTSLTFAAITETTTAHAAIRLANSSSPPTAYAFYPSTSVRGGDVFFGRTGQRPVMGNFDSAQATLHEIGHALGLKHGHESDTYGEMNADRLDIEFSLMNYANYIGSDEGYSTASSSPQTFMMYDIAALQYMYGGANFNQVGQNNTYTWSSTTGAGFINGASQGTPVDNHIFSTIWTAGATSTYDLSNFSQNQVNDMQPGGWMLFSTEHLAHLNARAPSKPSGDIFARGNIYNALQYNGDARSLITNITTGSGDDSVTGNAADNTIIGNGGNDSLFGNGGNDILAGGTGNDLLIGGGGTDTFYVGRGYGGDTVFDFARSQGDKINLTSFANVHSLLQVLARSSQSGADTVINLGGGDFVTLKNINHGSVVAGDFTFMAAATIESSASTAVVQVGSSYFLDASAGWEGPELRYGGTTFTLGQAAAWRPIATERMPNGYSVWFRNGSVDQYVMWSTDFAGNFFSSGAVVSGFGYALQSYEGYFQQDLNLDGFTGVRSAELETSGATKLAQVADMYFLYQGNGATGTLLSLNGAIFSAGQNGAWRAIGAEQMPNGYSVWWRNGNADQYAMWSTDFAGNYFTSGAIVSGSSYALQSYEGYFQQDLSGDGTTGLKSTVVETAGAVKLAQVSDMYFIYQGSGATGVVLRYVGNYVAADVGAWAPLGVELSGSGYQVVFKNSATDQYVQWTTDSNGNFQSSSVVMAANSAPLRLLETAFAQDFNSSGTVGLSQPMAPSSESNVDGTIALMVNYMASSFVTPGAGMTPIADPPSSPEILLTNPQGWSS